MMTKSDILDSSSPSLLSHCWLLFSGTPSWCWSKQARTPLLNLEPNYRPHSYLDPCNILCKLLSDEKENYFVEKYFENVSNPVLAKLAQYVIICLANCLS